MNAIVTMKKNIIILLFGCMAAGFAICQPPPKPYGPLPTPAQLKWHEMEMYGLIHFGVDTYTDKEWGYGNEDAALVNPKKFNAEQIVAAARAAGLKGVIVVAKHHDGLCLWPTSTTEHNISKSPWRNGKGDMVKEYQQACNKLGMKLGIYCSPWDRNNAAYGSAEYVSVYRSQLKELYSRYGPLFISWHDGANGGDGYYGGANEKRNIDRTTYYGWDTTFAITRKMQPSAVIFGDIGPDVRWVGNEEGHAGETCWATFTPEAPDEGRKPSNGYVKYWLATEGTRNGEYWMPAECDVPLRPGWFYHPSQDEQAKSPYTLLDLYYKSVGRGANLDLGLAPDRDGLLHANDVKTLKEFGELLGKIFSNNLAKNAAFTASNIRGNNAAKYGTAFLTDKDRYSYWATNDDMLTPGLIIDLKKPQTFNVIRLRENIRLGQRITSFAIDVFENGQWKEIAAATSIGSNRLIRLPQNITSAKLRLRITSANACIALSDFGLFKEPPHLTAPEIKRDRKGWVQITTAAPVASIHYTTDGSEPGLQSPLFDKPFQLSEGGMIKAKSFEVQNQASETTVAQFDLSKAGWKIISSSCSNDCKEENAIDENTHTAFNVLNPSTGVQQISIDMGKIEPIHAFTYLPAQGSKADGIVYKYSIDLSDDGIQWKFLMKDEFSNIKANPVGQVIRPDQPVSARYFRFSSLETVDGRGMNIAELGIKIK